MLTITRHDFEGSGSWGLQASIDLHACNTDTIREADRIREFVAELCSRIDVEPVGDCQVVHFGDSNPRVAGSSMVQFIETSLVSGHFVDQTGNVYLDIFSCSYFEAEPAVRYAAEYFEASDYQVHLCLRK